LRVGGFPDVEGLRVPTLDDVRDADDTAAGGAIGSGKTTKEYGYVPAGWSVAGSDDRWVSRNALVLSSVSASAIVDLAQTVQQFTDDDDAAAAAVPVSTASSTRLPLPSGGTTRFSSVGQFVAAGSHRQLMTSKSSSSSSSESSSASGTSRGSNSQHLNRKTRTYVWVLDRLSLPALSSGGEASGSASDLFLQVSKSRIGGTVTNDSGNANASRASLAPLELVCEVALVFDPCPTGTCKHGTCYVQQGDVPASMCACRCVLQHVINALAILFMNFFLFKKFIYADIRMLANTAMN
jgi:hypothetical protein